MRARYLMIPAALPKNLKIERITADRRPANWRSLAAWEELQAHLNPLHPQFGRIEVGEAEELVTDLRLLNRCAQSSRARA